MDILDVISRRTSVRSYRPESAPEADLEAVVEKGETADPLTPADLDFFLCTEEEVGGEVKGLLGDYGKVIRAPDYLVVAGRESPGYLVDAGYRFEQMVLEATARGLGTCWVGGFFREPSLRRALELDETWRIVALTPIGLPAEGGLMGRLVRSVIRSSTRKPIEQTFFWQRHGAPLRPTLTVDARWARLLEATRWAPSWANKQPWRFVVSTGEILLYKNLRQVKEGKDYHLVDCGIAMAHLHLAAAALGIVGRWHLASFEVPGAPEAEPVARYLYEEQPG